MSSYSSYSSATLIGNIVRDPEVKFIGSGTAVSNISVAVNERRKDAEDEVSFIDVTLWGRTAEVIAEYCHKGSKVCVVGRLKQETWEDKTGNKRSRLIVVADRVIMLDSKNSGQSAPPQRQATANEDTPF